MFLLDNPSSFTKEPGKEKYRFLPTTANLHMAYMANLWFGVFLMVYMPIVIVIVKDFLG